MQKMFIFYSLTLSLLIHLFIFGKQFSANAKKQSPQKPLQVRFVGEDKSQYENLAYIPRPKKQQKKKRTLRSLKQNLEIPGLESSAVKPKVVKSKNIKPAMDNLKISNSTIKSFLKSTPNYQAPQEVLRAMDDSNVVFDLVVPKGVKEDELNKHELVFYSFRKRTAMAYVNSFYKELYSFERKNPHIRFPITNKKEEIAGKLTFDKEGNILKIQTLKWTQVDMLQDFFMDVLKNMSSLPNPPKQIVNEKDQFVVNFILSVNNEY